MKRLAIGMGAVVLLAGVFVGGVAIGRATEDEPAADIGITEAEHNRLVESCTAETDQPSECAAWIAGVVEKA